MIAACARIIWAAALFNNYYCVWAASYSAFGKAGVITPAPTADKPVIESNLRLPGQYEDAETGLYYNWRRYYDPETGRYITQDPIGLDGGINQYRYASADPLNLTDPSGEIVPLVAAAAAFGECMAMCALATAAENAVTGQCNNWGGMAKDCAMGCAAGMGAGFLASKAFGWAKKGWQAFKNRPCAMSFPGDTLVHVKPRAGQAQDARQGKADLLPISALKVGDEVLAFSEWQAQGGQVGGDTRLSYEKVTDLFTSHKPQTLVHLTLEGGRTITATENHPFRTTEGWRDAILLKKGGQLLLKRDGEARSASIAALAHKASAQTTIETEAESKERVAVIVSVRLEEKTLPVFNLEVANGHTFFVGVDGVLVHNGRCTPKMRREWEKIHNEPWPRNPLDEKIHPGGNQDGHHVIPKNKGGADHGSNITPMTPSQHINHHQTNG